MSRLFRQAGTRTNQLFLFTTLLWFWFCQVTTTKAAEQQEHLSNFVYMLNETVGNNLASSYRIIPEICPTSKPSANCSSALGQLAAKISEEVATSDNDLAQADHETSASMLKLTHHQEAGNQPKRAKPEAAFEHQQQQPAPVRKKLVRLFGRAQAPATSGSSSSKKISIQALLPKSKRQDSAPGKSNAITQPSRGPPPRQQHFIPRQQPMMLEAGFTPLNQQPFYGLQPPRAGPLMEQGNLFDQSVAQSMENYQRIQLNKHQTDPSVYFASTGNGALPATNQNRQQAQQSLLSSTTAGHLLGGRAKELMSFINLPQQQQEQQASSSVTNNHRTGSGNLRASQSNLNGLASIIKSAAEAWASSSTGTAEATPTIILEHDGPSITTVDFNNNLQQQPQLDDDEPEENDDFYSQEVEQTESEGSQNHNKRTRQRPAAFGNQPVHSQNVQSELPASNSAESFYGSGDLPLQANDDLLLQELLQNKQARRNNNRQQLYPDSINAAIREQQRYGKNRNNEEEEGKSRRRNRDNNNDQLERLIRELQDLRERGRGSEVSEKIRSFLDDAGEPTSENGELDNDNPDLQYDEQTARLRRKLLAKLKAKSERRKPASASGASEGSFASGEVKIPLHALLLAALDRRMSPSEKSSQTVSFDNELIVDDRNKAVVAAAKEDFDDISSSLGSLTDNNNNLYDSMLSQANGENRTRPAEIVTNVTTTTTPSPPSMFILNNFGAGSENSPQLAANSSDSNSNSPAGEEPEEGSPTTPMPTRAAIRNRKGRRDLTGRGGEEGDFDVARQVDEFANDDNNEQQLMEPAYMREGKGRKRSGNSVEFDDDNDHEDDEQEKSAGSSRRARKGRRRLPPDEASYERNGDKFLERVHRDTDNGEADLERNTSGIDDPIGPGSEEGEEPPTASSRRRQRRLPGRSRRPRRRENGDEEADDDDPEDIDRPSVTASELEDSADEDQEERRPAESVRRGRRRERKWRPQIVDEEVRRIERLAQADRRRRVARKQLPAPDSSESDGDQQDEESQNLPSTSRPEQPVLRLTIDSSAGNIERISASSPGSEVSQAANSTIRIVQQ